MVTIELTLNVQGTPIIKFRHQDKSNDLYEKVLGEFVRLAKKNGLKLVNPSGMVSTEGESHENYEITINED